MMNSPCFQCERHTSDCRQGCEEYAAWEILRILLSPKQDEGALKADEFLFEQSKKRKKRWGDKNRNKH